MLAFDDIKGYLHYYAFRYEDYQFEHWELVNEAWIVVHSLNTIKFASQGIRWAMLLYKRKEKAHRHYGRSSAIVISLETPIGIDRVLRDILFSTKVRKSALDDRDTISWLADNANLCLDERMVIDQRFWKCMTFREIAKNRGCTHSNVGMLLTRITDKLCRAARRLEKGDSFVLAG